MISLHGLRVLNTRPLGQQHLLTEAIQSAGGVCIECPLLRIEPLEFMQWPYLKHLADIDQMIFISTNAVHYFFEYLHAVHLALPPSIQVLAIGEATENQLISRGVRVDARPDEPSSEALLKLEQMQAVKNQTIVLIKGEHGREKIVNTLTTRGAFVTWVDVYQRGYPEDNKVLLDSLWHDDAIDVMIFTSAQAMQHLFTLLPPQAHEWIRQKVSVVISDRLAQVADQLGIKQVIVSPYNHLIATLRKCNDKKE